MGTYKIHGHELSASHTNSSSLYVSVHFTYVHVWSTPLICMHLWVSKSSQWRLIHFLTHACAPRMKKCKDYIFTSVTWPFVVLTACATDTNSLLVFLFHNCFVVGWYSCTSFLPCSSTFLPVRPYMQLIFMETFHVECECAWSAVHLNIFSVRRIKSMRFTINHTGHYILQWHAHIHKLTLCMICMQLHIVMWYM